MTIGDPEGFGFEHYDQTPSSLQPGDGTRQESPSFIGGSSLNPQDIINTVASQLNTYQNTKENSNTGNSTISLNTTTPQNGGLQGFQFPVAPSTTNATIVATQSTVGK